MSEIHKPHTAIISIQLEVHSLLDTGECSGRVVNQQTLEQYGIKNKSIILVNGYNMEDCLKNLKNKLEKLNEYDE